MHDIPLESVTSDAIINAPSVPPLATPMADTIAPSESHRFSFTGTTGGFFAIWIVNLFLTIVTLGIYSAWAKVRKKRFFYGHTWVADANFEYHGNPIAILKGRLIAFAALVAYSATGHFMPKLAAVLAIALFVAAPWFIARSMAFNAFNSSYRNIRFRFHATYGDVLKAIWPFALVLVFPLLMPELDRTGKGPVPTMFWVILVLQMLTLAAVYPYVVGSLKKLHVNHSQFGAAPFATEVGIGAFYKIYFMMILLAIGVGVVISIVFAVITGTAAAFGAGAAIFGMILVGVAVIVFYFGTGALLMGYTRSRIGNLVFNNSRLDGQVSFTSTLKMRKLALLYLTNLFAILFSLGLAIPWAVVRVMRYRAECLSLQSASSMDEFIGAVNAQVGATGEELGEFFSIDLSL